MWQKLSTNPWALSILAALALIFAYAPFDLCFLCFLLPFFFTGMFFQLKTERQALWFGFFHSLVLMWGGFYWVVYVIHVFGELGWIPSALLYVGFCGIGALNIPLFSWLTFRLYRRIPAKAPTWVAGLWFAVFFPAWFTILEFLIPKLFPWYLGHALYRYPVLIQIVEWTGVSFLTFSLFSAGSTAAAYVWRSQHGYALPRWLPAIPIGLWTFALIFGAVRLQAPLPDGPTLNLALVQANIGSLDRVKAKMGIGGRLRFVMDKYISLTEKALKQTPKPNLILWPETAMPFQMESPIRYAQEIRQKVVEWGVPLVVGAYAQSPFHFDRDYNAAFLVEPRPVTQPGYRLSIAPKNVLLAFGEYMPLGDTFPALYRWFPQVSNFELGREQTVFQTLDGIRLGVTICYEAIIPSFVRKVANRKIQALLNLTNDSWFGPTSEPYQHGQLSIFRAIETRTPLIRVTNTGTSFVVDTNGHIGKMTPVYDEAVLLETVHLPSTPPETIYVKLGEWWNLLLMAGWIGFMISLRKYNASLRP